MARAAKGKKGKTSVKVNFKGVESRKTPPEGDYICRVVEATMGKSGNQNDQIEFVAEIAKGEYKGVKLWFYCTLDEKSLWKLHAFLTALGEDVPDDDMDIDLSELLELEFVGVLTHETYKGKKRAKLTDFDSVENYAGDADDDDDEDDKKSKKKSKKSKKSDDDDDEDEKPKKGKKSKKSSEDDDDDDEDDDDDKPAKGKKSKDKGKKKPKKLDRDEIEEMDEDELQELIDEHDLDVDLDDFKKLPKKVAAVLEALEEADLVDEED